MQSYISHRRGRVFNPLIFFFFFVIILLYWFVTKNIGKYDISGKCGKSRKYDIYVERFYENVAFHAVRCFKLIANTLYISSWKSKGLSAETIKPPSTSDSSITPLIDYVGNKIRLKFSGSCLKQPKLQYTHGTIVNI